MSAIGGIAVFSITGEPDLPGFTSETITRANVAGVAFRLNGKRGKPFELVITRDVLNETVGAVYQLAMKALEGTVITFVNDRGTTYVNYYCHKVEHVSEIPLLGSVGGVSGPSQATFWITHRVTLQYTLAA